MSEFGRAASSLGGRLADLWQSVAGVGRAELVPQTRFTGPMPWVIAIMVALTVIAMSAGLTLNNAAHVAAAELEGGITVQLLEARPETQEAETRAAMARLREMDEVKSLRRVTREEVDALIEPWLGSGAEDGVASAIPVPALIDVQLNAPATAERVAAIAAELRPIAPSARVDAQSGWLRPVFDAIKSLQWLAFALVILLAAALGAAVLLAARSALGANRETIEIVHLLGGSDSQIARVFQRSIGIESAAGGAVGLVMALVVILFLGRRFASLGAGMVDNGALGWGDWLLLAAIPVFITILAMVTARVTVMRTLRKML